MRLKGFFGSDRNAFLLKFYKIITQRPWPINAYTFRSVPSFMSLQSLDFFSKLYVYMRKGECNLLIFFSKFYVREGGR